MLGQILTDLGHKDHAKIVKVALQENVGRVIDCFANNVLHLISHQIIIPPCL